MPTLIIEDGTGKIDSNTYNDLAAFKLYFDNIGVDVSTLTDPTIEAALFETGTTLLEIMFNYKGCISYPDTPQALSFPRTGLVDRRGLVVAEDAVPPELLAAQNELARSVAINDRLAYSDAPDNTGAVKKEKLDVLMTEYFGPGTAPSILITQDVEAYVTKLLAPYIKGSNRFQINNIAVQ